MQYEWGRGCRGTQLASRQGKKRGAKMKSSLVSGLSATRRIAIDVPRTIDFLGEQLRVYNTPSLLFDFEVTCRDLLLEYLDKGEDSVGTSINMSHSGATLCGMHVTLEVRINKVEGRFVTFDLLARDDVEEISRGSHSRAIVDVEKLRARVAAKAAKLGTLA
jgi:predicted thioesterase